MNDLKASDIFSVDGAPKIDNPDQPVSKLSADSGGTVSEATSQKTEEFSEKEESSENSTALVTDEQAAPVSVQDTGNSSLPTALEKTGDTDKNDQKTDEQKDGGEPRRSHPLFYMFAGAALIILAAFGVFFLRRNENKESIDPSGYVIFTAEGNDGAGKVSVSFDAERFTEDYGRAVQINRDLYLKAGYSEDVLKEEQPAQILAQYLSDSLRVEADQGKLGNGGAVAADIDADEDTLSDIYNVTLTTSEVPFVISGLNKLSSFDPFEGVKIVYSGVSPDASARIVRTGQALSDNIPMKLSKSSGIAQGDTITVSLDVQDPEQYCIEKYGRTPLRTSAAYKADSADTWLSDAGQLTGSDLSKLKNSAAAAVSDEVKKDAGSAADKFEISYQGYYLFSGSTTADTKNTLYLIMQVKADESLTGDDLTDNTWYACVVYDNVIVKEDGISYTSPHLEGDNLFVTSQENADSRTSHVVGYRSALQVKKEMLLKESNGHSVTTDFDLRADGLQSEAG